MGNKCCANELEEDTNVNILPPNHRRVLNDNYRRHNRNKSVINITSKQNLTTDDKIPSIHTQNKQNQKDQLEQENDKNQIFQNINNTIDYSQLESNIRKGPQQQLQINQGIDETPYLSKNEDEQIQLNIKQKATSDDQKTFQNNETIETPSQITKLTSEIDQNTSSQQINDKSLSFSLIKDFSQMTPQQQSFVQNQKDSSQRTQPSQKSIKIQSPNHRVRILNKTEDPQQLINQVGFFLADKDTPSNLSNPLRNVQQFNEYQFKNDNFISLDEEQNKQQKDNLNKNISDLQNKVNFKQIQIAQKLDGDYHIGQYVESPYLTVDSAEIESQTSQFIRRNPDNASRNQISPIISDRLNATSQNDRSDHIISIDEYKKIHPTLIQTQTQEYIQAINALIQTPNQGFDQKQNKSQFESDFYQSNSIVHHSEFKSHTRVQIIDSQFDSGSRYECNLDNPYSEDLENGKNSRRESVNSQVFKVYQKNQKQNLSSLRNSSSNASFLQSKNYTNTSIKKIETQYSQNQDDQISDQTSQQNLVSVSQRSKSSNHSKGNLMRAHVPHRSLSPQGYSQAAQIIYRGRSPQQNKKYSRVMFGNFKSQRQVIQDDGQPPVILEEEQEYMRPKQHLFDKKANTTRQSINEILNMQTDHQSAADIEDEEINIPNNLLINQNMNNSNLTNQSNYKPQHQEDIYLNIEQDIETLKTIKQQSRNKNSLHMRQSTQQVLNYKPNSYQFDQVIDDLRKSYQNIFANQNQI